MCADIFPYVCQTGHKRFQKYHVKYALVGGYAAALYDAISNDAKVVGNYKIDPGDAMQYLKLEFTSQDSRSRPVRVENESPEYDLRTKALIKQDVPVEYIVTGNKAKLLYEAIQKLKKQEGQTSAQTQAVATTAVVIVLILAAVVVIGMIVLYVILHGAMERGYDVESTKYKAEVGSGEARQQHELAFNLTKPRQ